MTTLTRRALYDLVWSKPTSKVASDFGISDVGLKKICDKHRVPTPARGYWAKKAAGHQVAQVVFRETTDAAIEHVTISGNQAALPDEVQKVLKDERERRKIRPKPALPPLIAEPIADVHRLIAPTAKRLRGSKPGKDGAVHALDERSCGVTVGSGSVERAIAILDGLARRLDQRQLVLEPTGQAMKISFGSDDLTLQLNERVEWVKHMPTIDELAAEARLQKRRDRDLNYAISTMGDRSYPESDAVRTGLLSLEIKNEYVSGLRRSWRDGKTQRLELMLDDVAAGVAAYLAGLKARREQWAQAEWALQARLRELARLRAEREEKRRNFVRQHAGTVREIEELKALQAHLASHQDASAPAELTRFLAWLDDRIGRLLHDVEPRGMGELLSQAGLFPEEDPLLPENTDDRADADEGK